MCVKAILKSTKGQVSSQILSVDQEKQLVLYKNVKVNLTALEYGLFLLLYNSPERIYSREQIIDLA